MSRLRSGSILLLVGTSKGAFIFRSDERRRKWSLDGPFFRGLNVHHFVLDPRDRETLYAATFSDWWGCDIQRSRDGGKTWRSVSRGLPERNAHLLVLREAMSTDSADPAGVYFGTATGQIFHSRDEGREWRLLADCLPPIYTVEAFGP